MLIFSHLIFGTVTHNWKLQEASVFFKKRAALEEEYGRGLLKLARTTSETYAMNDGKAGRVI